MKVQSLLDAYALSYHLYIVCKMNVHHRCHSLVPRTCGQDLTEPYGRIQLAIICTPLDDDSQRVNIQS